MSEIYGTMADSNNGTKNDDTIVRNSGQERAYAADAGSNGAVDAVKYALLNNTAAWWTVRVEVINSKDQKEFIEWSVHEDKLSAEDAASDINRSGRITAQVIDLQGKVLKNKDDLSSMYN